MKKIVLLLLVLAMTFSLTACGKKDGGSASENTNVSLKVWGSQDDQEFLNERIEAFKAANPKVTWDIQLGVVGEPDAKTKVLEDVSAAADVFAMPDDQVYDLVKAGALQKVTREADVKYVKDENTGFDEFSVDGTLYGYPFAADNGYFMYYNSKVLKNIDTLDGILEEAQAQGKKVFMDLSNGWYIASFFLGNGGKLTVENGKQICDFDNDKGIQAGEAIKKFAAHPAFVTGDDNVLKEGMKSGEIVAAVSGTWNAKDFKEILGEGYAAAKLPTFTVDGKQVQMSSFKSFKGYGVNSQTKFPVEAMNLAMFLTSEESQNKRFEARQTGPSNIKASQSDAVKADVALNALISQNKHAQAQRALGSYWTPAEAFGTAMEGKDYSKSVAELLKEMVEQITKAQ